MMVPYMVDQILDTGDQDDKDTQVCLSNIFFSWWFGYIVNLKL